MTTNRSDRVQSLIAAARKRATRIGNQLFSPRPRGRRPAVPAQRPLEYLQTFFAPGILEVPSIPGSYIERERLPAATPRRRKKNSTSPKSKIRITLEGGGRRIDPPGNNHDSD